MNQNISASFRNILLGSAAGVGTALSVSEVAGYADAWTEAGNKINAAAQSMGVSARPLSELNRGAIEARASITDYADLYARVLRSSSNVAKNEQEIATATSTVAKAFKAGGASAQEQAAGIMQLGQALGSGVLQGDELRSLRENAPILADAIAKEFKTTIAGLKELGAEGKLTSDRVFKAILAAQKPIEAQFQATNATIGDSFTRLKNEITQYVGSADSSVGASGKIGDVMGLLSDNIGAVADAVIVLSGALLVNYAGNAVNGAVAATYKLASAQLTERAASVETARTALAAAQAKQAAAAANVRYAETALLAARNGAALGLSVQKASRDMLAAQTALTAANSKVVLTTAAANAAIANTGIIATVSAGAMRAFGGALALVGGPAGAALLAAYALYQMYDANTDAERAAKSHGETVKALGFEIQNLDYANSEAVASTRTKIVSDIEAAKAALQRAKAERELAASIIKDEVNPSMSLLAAPAANDVQNTVSESPVVKDRQALIDALDKQLVDLEGINSKFEAYASGKEKPTQNTAGFGGGIGDAGKSGKTKAPKKTADDRFSEDIQAVKDRTAALIQEQQIVGQSFYVQEKRRMALDLEQQALRDVREEARKKGVADWQNAQLTPDHVTKINAASEAYAKQADVLRQLEEAQQRAESASQEFYDTAKSGFVDVIRGTTSLSEAISNLAGKLSDLFLNSAFDSMFGGSKATGSGGWLSNIFKGLGFADGGWTGAGGKYQPAGVVHKGEYVFDADSVRRAGGPAAMDAMRRGLKGYADGGSVGAVSVPRVPNVAAMNAARSGNMTVDARTTIQASGNEETDAKLMAFARERDAQLPSQVYKIIKDGQKRRII
ncbi:tape measure protein [Agrobacterium tumefaciens]|uniref:tape measure protein n=1 Tax=Agrobacterium tumefaciens TaxID=358 RepID=UPI001BB55319|nr:tape measure protein [Agrobacterium tumefaciens]